MTTAMDSTNTEPTAKDFQEPLLMVLHDLAEGKAAVPVPFKDTYGPVMTLKGISSLDAYGHMADGKEKVAQWIQWAFKNLKRTGQVELDGRGQWALTKEGLVEAAKIASQAAPAPASAPQVLPSTGVVSVVSPGYAEDGYHPDPYIRILAANATGCFGHYSHKSTICERCPLQGPCINFVASELSSLAATLQKEDQAAATRQAPLAAAKAAQAQAAATAGATPPPPTPPTPGAGTGDDFDWTVWQTNKKKTLLSKAESNCPRCRKPVKKGGQAVWLRLKSKVGDRAKSVLFHVECGPPDGV